MRTWGALGRETRRRVATAIPLLIIRSMHSSSAQSGAWQGRPSVRQWVLSSLLTQWSLCGFSRNESGRSSSHSSHSWWRRKSSMGVGRVTAWRVRRNRIGAFAPGRESQAEGPAASVGVRGGGSFISTGWCGWLVKPNGRMAGELGSGRTDDETVVHDYKPETIANEVQSRKVVPRAVIGSREGVFRFNRYA